MSAILPGRAEENEKVSIRAGGLHVPALTATRLPTFFLIEASIIIGLSMRRGRFRRVATLRPK